MSHNVALVDLSAVTDTESLRALIKSAQLRILDIVSKCAHQIVPNDPKFPHSSHPVCTVCKEHFFRQWFCPKNTTGFCEYEYGSRYNGEHCIHCHQPRERT